MQGRNGFFRTRSGHVGIEKIDSLISSAAATASWACSNAMSIEVPLSSEITRVSVPEGRAEARA